MKIFSGGIFLQGPGELVWQSDNKVRVDEKEGIEKNESKREFRIAVIVVVQLNLTLEPSTIYTLHMIWINFKWSLEDPLSYGCGFYNLEP